MGIKRAMSNLTESVWVGTDGEHVWVEGGAIAGPHSHKNVHSLLRVSVEDGELVVVVLQGPEAERLELARLALTQFVHADSIHDDASYQANAERASGEHHRGHNGSAGH